MNKTNRLVIDTFCVGSLVAITFRGYIKKYREIYFCRSTYLGDLFLKLFNVLGRGKIREAPKNINDLLGGNAFYERKKIQMLLMRSYKVKNIKRLSSLLLINPDVLEKSFEIFSWVLFFAASEAIVVAKSLNADTLCLLEGACVLKGDINVLTYKRQMDVSKFKKRQGFVLEGSDALLSKTRIIFSTLLHYAIASIVSLKRGGFLLEQKEIIVHTLRKNLNIAKKNDLFWCADQQPFKRTLLLLGSPCNMVGVSDQIERINISKNLFGGLRKNKCYLLKKKVALKYKESFFLQVKLWFFCLFSRHNTALLNWLNNVLLYRSIFLAYQSKVFVSNQDYSNSSPYLAAKMSNVVYVRSTWSTHLYKHTRFATISDVFFSWGNAISHPYWESWSSETKFVNVGFIDGGLINQNLKLPLGSPPKVCIGFFDNVTGHDLPNTTAQLKEVFYMLYQLLNEHKSVCVLYKPKSGDFREIDKANVRDLITPYIKEGRFTVLTGEKSYDHMPVELADKVDLVLGYPISTAATETMIAGVPSFHLNLTGLREHYWEKNGFDEAIFYSVEEAKERLSKYIENPESIPRPSKSLLKTVNHFNDYKAKERMQKYIEFLCDGEGLSVSDRVQNANQKYYQLDIVKKFGMAEKQECEDVINAH